MATFGPPPIRTWPEMPAPWQQWLYELWQRVGAATGPGTNDLAASLADDVPQADAEVLRSFDAIGSAPDAVAVAQFLAQQQEAIGAAPSPGAAPYPVPEEWLAPAHQYDGELASGRDTLLHTHPFVFLAPASITLNAGTGTGSVTDLQTMLDGNAYHIDEAAATPGFDLEVNFTGVTRIRGVQVRCFYDGPDTHVVRIEVRNQTGAAWDVLNTFVGNQGDFDTILSLLPDDANYIDGSGNAAVRIYHVSAGNASHDIDIDFVGLLA